MSSQTSTPVIRLRGVHHNNLRNFDLDLPLHRLIVITGLSGSGKSSLAFDTLFAEGQRRYIETFSAYARQFFDRMDKPQVDSIEGIPPAIAIEQRNAVRTTRSTVGTMTEICDYMKLVWPHVARVHCRNCGDLVRADAPQQIWEALHARRSNSEILICFDLPLSEKLSLSECLTLVGRQGYQRLLAGGKVLRLEEAEAALREQQFTSLTVVQDRLRVGPSARPRFVEACEHAYHFGKGKLAIYPMAASADALILAEPERFSNRLHCARCDIEYREGTPALFSFNHPVGACPTCRGFGRTITIDYNLALPDRSRTLAQGVVKPWLTGQSAECQDDMMRFCRKIHVPVDVPFCDLDPKWQDWVINGDPNYGKDKQHEWPKAWYGIKGYFRWLESKSYKMHVRVLLSRYRSYRPCTSCQGQRLQPDALLFRLDAGSSGPSASLNAGARGTHAGATLADFYRLPIRESLRLTEELIAQRKAKRGDPIAIALSEVQSRLAYLAEVGLGYLTLDRPTRTLSGGETERVNLTTCLGTRLVNTLFVLDEPSVGLHPRDTARLVALLQKLRDAGNTVVVVEHEAGVIRAADQVVDLGPGHGESGGRIVFQGTFKELLRAEGTLTGEYLSGRKRITPPPRREVLLDGSTPGRPSSSEALVLSHATAHNLKDVTVAIPLQRFVCLTGVSGSGKTTLLRDLLLPALEARLSQTKTGRGVAAPPPSPSGQPGEGQGEDSPDPERVVEVALAQTILTGHEHLGRVVMVDQSSLGKTPRSNPAVYVGAFDHIREIFAQSELAKQRGFNASSFSFNSQMGQCEHCRGAGFEKIEMQFLSDVFIRCAECDGHRYRPHILAVSISPPNSGPANGGTSAPKCWSIADCLEATVDEVVTFLEAFGENRAAKRAIEGLRLLQETGLGYLRLGQPINTLSGGESQRLKLVSHLAETRSASSTKAAPGASGSPTALPCLFLFDEPTTGLHFDDVRVLLQVFQRLVNAGHSVLVIEHNLEVIKCADWVIDLGPDAGDDGGCVVVSGTPEDVAACKESHTGAALRELGLRRKRQSTSGTP